MLHASQNPGLNSELSTISSPSTFYDCNSPRLCAMPRLRGRKLECFYCGCRSAQTYTQGLGEWQCKKCDAVNYLDKVCLLSAQSMCYRLTTRMVEWRDNRPSRFTNPLADSLCRTKASTSLPGNLPSRRIPLLPDLPQESASLDAVFGRVLSLAGPPRLCQVRKRVSSISQESRGTIPADL